jgi:hypothetical protein
MNNLKKMLCKSVTAFISLMLCALVCQATVGGPPSDDQMILEARAIVVAKVLYVESNLNASDNSISTYITLKVQQVLKGQINTRKVVLKEPGGTVGNRTEKVIGALTFIPGETVLVYLNTWKDGSLRLHNFVFSKFSIVNDADLGQSFVTRDVGEDEGYVLRQNKDLNTTHRMEMTEYIEMVKSKLAINKERVKELESTDYKDVPLLMQPPNYASLVEEKLLHPQSLISPQFVLAGHRWGQFDTGLTVRLLTNPSQAPAGTSPRADANAAMSVWNSVSGANIILGGGSPTTLCGQPYPGTGENVIFYNNCDGYWPSTSCFSSQNIALTRVSQNNDSFLVNGTCYSKVIQVAITFNPSAACFYANDCELQFILTHEIGHVLGLHHSANPNATMSTNYFTGRCADLKLDDKDGARAIYPPGTYGPCN